MNPKKFIFVLILFCPILIYGQLFTLLDNHYYIEYEAAYPNSYWAELLDVWKISGLQYGQTVTFDFADRDGTGDLITSVVYDFENYHDWDKPEDLTSTIQTWTWRGVNGGSDYISVDIYIDDYADVEIGILDAITLGIIRYPSPTQWENTFAEVRTSMMLPDPPNLDCYVPVVYPLHNFGGVEGASASWVIKQNGTPKASGTGSYAVTSNISDGAVDLEFTVTFPGEDLEPLTFSEEYGFGIFNNAVITGTTGVCPDSYYIYTCQVPGGHSGTYSYSWTYPSNWMWPFQADNTIRLKTPMYNPDYGTVRAKITNACGTSSEYSGITVYPGYNCGGYYMASPNPTVEYTEIDIASEEAKALDTKYDSDITLTVVDKMGAPISKVNVERLPYRLNTSKLPKGEYIIQIISQPKDREALVESLKIIVNH